MAFFRSFFKSPQRERAASGSLTPNAWLIASLGICANLRSAHGIDLIAYPVRNTNSMVPAFDSNAVLLAEKVDFDALRAGDIVTFRAAGSLVVHRLIEKRGDAWWPRGDGNTRMDPWTVTRANFDRRICGILYGAKDAETDK